MHSFCLKSLLAAGALSLLSGCGSSGGGGGDTLAPAPLPESKAGTVTTEHAKGFVGSSTGGGLQSVEKLALGSEDSKTAVGQLQGITSPAGGASYNMAEEDQTCDPVITGEKADADSDGFHVDMTAVYDCNISQMGFLNMKYQGTTVSSDEDDKDDKSPGRFEVKNLKMTMSFAGTTEGAFVAPKEGTGEINFSMEILSNGYLERTTSEEGNRDVEVKFTMASKYSGLPDGAGVSVDMSPTFSYNILSSLDPDKNEMTVTGFYGSTGVVPSEDENATPESYNYTMEVATPTPLKVTEACSAKNSYAGGVMTFTAESGVVEVTYDETCDRVVKLNGEVLDLDSAT